MKKVIGFNPDHHCAKCLIGSYDKNLGLSVPVNEDICLDYDEGSILYLCGVSSPYRHANNFHLAMMVKRGAFAEKWAWNGDKMRISGAQRIEFSAEKAFEKYNSKGRSFTTCRNFQFGAQLFDT